MNGTQLFFSRTLLEGPADLVSRLYLVAGVYPDWGLIGVILIIILTYKVLPKEPLIRHSGPLLQKFTFRPCSLTPFGRLLRGQVLAHLITPAGATGP